VRRVIALFRVGSSYRARHSAQPGSCPTAAANDLFTVAPGAVVVRPKESRERMTRQQLLDKRDFFNLVHGITLRAIETFADSELDFRPKPGMRTPRELVFHIYGQEQALAEAARDGSFTMELANRSNPEDPSGTAAVSALATVADAVGYARACHDAAERIFRAMSEDDVVRPVNSPFGTYPAWQYLVFAYDEHWHHRGQLYTYLRLLGKEPPMLYDYQVSVG
jgi:uncharacterized damage-inducible protein DinB